ncbi:hypothetical protein GPECTOR_1g162 [Gonium pectorale]|uniref:Ricin B lectin domain-containing protein n=1 Tax=Gonium pectorale TaxID=33097 RepID=A0A150H2W9_GONPE|nr:hypothetical protein GPECTOR_1g162 [Gonium pectorale]|eukprot:KXZ56188.1 hypothetical protein GPECTOR_1g162 [Gonium pectorale]
MVGGWTHVYDGYWGTWRPASFPCNKQSYNAARGTMELVGMPISAFRLRIEPYQGGGDDTAINGIQWTGFTYCPDNTYICGLQVKMEAPQGWGDDTALNGLAIACCGFPVNNSTAVVSTTNITTSTNGDRSCLTLETGDNAQTVGTRVLQYLCANSPRQLFVFTSQPTGEYTITTVPSGLCVVPKDGGTAQGTGVVLNTCRGSRTEMWAVTPLGGNRYHIRSAHANRCFDVSWGVATDGAVIQLIDCYATNNQVVKLNLPTRSTTTGIQTKTS